MRAPDGAPIGLGIEMTEHESEVVEAEVVPVARSASGLGFDLPDDPNEAISLLLEHLAESREEATSYLDDLRRVAADFDNYRKRTTREQAMVLDRAAERVVRELLPVLDSFDAALKHDPATDGERLLLAGLPYPVSCLQRPPYVSVCCSSVSMRATTMSMAIVLRPPSGMITSA